MKLTDQEKKMLDGHLGTGPRSAMRLLVTLGGDLRCRADDPGLFLPCGRPQLPNIG